MLGGSRSRGKLTLGCHSGASSGQIFTGLLLSVEVAASQDDHLHQIVQPISEEDCNSKENLHPQKNEVCHNISRVQMQG